MFYAKIKSDSELRFKNSLQSSLIISLMAFATCLVNDCELR